MFVSKRFISCGNTARQFVFSDDTYL